MPYLFLKIMNAILDTDTKDVEKVCLDEAPWQ